MICLICYDEDKDLLTLECCKNHFHDECIRRWFERNLSCPTCRIRYIWEFVYEIQKGSDINIPLIRDI